MVDYVFYHDNKGLRRDKKVLALTIKSVRS